MLASFLVAFVALSGLGMCWALAQPLLSGADESAHIAWTEAVMSGQWFGRLHSATPAMVAVHSVSQNKITDPDIAHPLGNPGCYFADPAIPASCDRGERRAWKTYPGPTYVARYPPVAYVTFGLPLAIHPGALALYLSRALNVLATAALVAVAVALAAARRDRILVAGVVAACVPGFVAGAGVLNPSAIETAGAILLWTIAALIVRGEALTPRLAWVFAADALVVEFTRPISFAWPVLAAVAVAVAVPRRQIIAAGARRATTTIPLLVAAVGAVGGALWFLLLGDGPDPLYAVANPTVVSHSTSQSLSIGLAALGVNWDQLVAAVGYNEYNGPWVVRVAWSAATVGAVGSALIFATRRVRVCVAGLAVAIPLLDLAATVAEARKSGPFWQGRYDRPIAVGVIILGAAVAGRAAEARVPELRSVVRWCLGGWVLLQVAELVGGLRRYVVGIGGPLAPWHWGRGWHPPLPWWALLLAAIITASALAVWVATLATGGPERDPPSRRRDPAVPAAA